MEGLAKSAPVAQPIVTPRAVDVSDPNVIFTDAGVPIDVFGFYDKAFGNEEKPTINQMKTVYDYARSMSQDHKSAMRVLAEYDLQLGMPQAGETRLSRVFNKVRLLTIAKQLNRER